MKVVLKKFFSAVLLLCLIFLTLTGCYHKSVGEKDTLGSETEPSQDNTTTSEKQPASKEDPTITEKEDGVLSETDQLRLDYNLGTCKALSGNVSVVLFYIDDFESSWTDTEIDLFTKNEVEPGLSFLEKEAKKYGVELNLTVKKSYSAIYYDDEVITSVKDTGLASADVLWQAALQINYSSSGKMIDAFRSQYKTDEVVCFTIFNKSGTAYALNPTRGADIKIDEHCIVFARDLHSTENGRAGYQAAVIAHEMLHLFGAEDFYASASRKSLAKAYYSSDIMLSAAYDIRTNTIEEATAFYIGWTDEIPNILYNENW